MVTSPLEWRFKAHRNKETDGFRYKGKLLVKLFLGLFLFLGTNILLIIIHTHNTSRCTNIFANVSHFSLRKFEEK